MKKKILILGVVFLFAAVNACADTVTLKSGKQVTGKIIEQTSDSVKIDLEGVEITYFLDELEAINGQKITASSAASSDISTQASPEKETSGGLAVPLSTPEVSQAPAAAKTKENPKAFSGLYQQEVGAKRNTFAAWVALGVLLFLVLVYLYFSFCLQLIAKLTNQEPAWLAWIPIANFFLMCKIASLSYLWLLVIPIFFVPFVGPFINLGFFGFLYYRIALARKKPGWIGILAIIPLVNLVIVGYLAFSE
jgi:hypothetical protein